jgi:hypothetical protein
MKKLEAQFGIPEIRCFREIQENSSPRSIYICHVYAWEGKLVTRTHT